MHNVAARAVLPSAEDGRKEYAESFIQLRNEYADGTIFLLIKLDSKFQWELIMADRW